MSISPPLLVTSDSIAIVCTARSVQKNELLFAKQTAEQMGFKVIFGQTIDQKYAIFGGSPQERANDFNKALYDTSIKAIWCARGGYGSCQMIDLIDWKYYQKHPKWIIGFSDVTQLLQKSISLGIHAVHAIMPKLVDKTNKNDAIELLKLLQQGPSKIHFAAQNTPQANMSAQLLGGNLATIYSLLSNDDLVPKEPFILFIEEVDEYIYQIERMMYAIERSKWNTHLKGLLIGSFTEIKDNEVAFGQSWQQILINFAKRNEIPIFFNFPAGHGMYKKPLLLGATVNLQTTDKHSILNYSLVAV